MSKLTMYKVQNTIAVGATTGTSFSKPIRGKIVAIKLIYSNTTHSSSSDRDINIFEMNPEDPLVVGDALQEILNVGDLGADPDADNAVYYPRTAAQDNAAASLVYLSTDTAVVPTEYVVFGRVMLAITAAAAGDITTAYIIVEEY